MNRIASPQDDAFSKTESLNYFEDKIALIFYF